MRDCAGRRAAGHRVKGDSGSHGSHRLPGIPPAVIATGRDPCGVIRARERCRVQPDERLFLNNARYAGNGAERFLPVNSHIA
jgi:hypothetical protein